MSCFFLTYSVETKTRNYDTIREACAQKLTRVRSIYRTEPTTKSGKTENRKAKITDAPRNIGKKSVESAEPVPEKKRKTTAGRIRRKGRLQAGNESMSGSDGMLLCINVTSDISYNTSNDSYNIFN